MRAYQVEEPDGEGLDTEDEDEDEDADVDMDDDDDGASFASVDELEGAHLGTNFLSFCSSSELYR